MKETVRRRLKWRWALLLIGLLALILLPFALFEAPLERWARGVVGPGSGAWLGPGIAGLLALDVLLPVPSSLVSTASGAVLGFWGGLLASTAGMTAGCLVGYVLGRGAVKAGVRRLVGDDELSRVKDLWDRHGAWTLVVLRGVPVLS